MEETAHSVLGAGASVKVEMIRRDFALPDGVSGSFWARLLLSSRQGLVGTIEFLEEPFAAEMNSLSDEMLVSRSLDQFSDRALYPEMIRVLAATQPLLTPRALGSIREFRVAECESQLNLPDLTRLYDTLVWSPQMRMASELAAFATFYFTHDTLKIAQLIVNADLLLRPNTKLDLRGRGWGSMVVKEALVRFPGTRRVAVPELVEDNAAPLKTVRAESFADALARVPTYRALNRLGFPKVRSFFVRGHTLDHDHLPTYGFAVERL